MQLQSMPERLRLLRTLRDKVELDLNLEFTPSCLGDFEGRLFDCAE